MKGKFFSVFLGVLLVILIAFTGVVIYAKFFYEGEAKEVVVDENVIKLQDLSAIINNSEFKNRFFDNTFIQTAGSDDNFTFLLSHQDQTNEVFELLYENNNIIIEISDNLSIDYAKIFTQIIVSGIGVINNYDEDSFIETVDLLFHGQLVANLTYQDNKITISLKNKIEPLTIKNKTELIKDNAIYYGNEFLIPITKKDFVILQDNYLAHNIIFEYNPTYNVFKINMEVQDYNIETADFVIESMLYDANKQKIKEVNFNYSFFGEKTANISIDHELSESVNIDNIKYIKLRFMKK